MHSPWPQVRPRAESADRAPRTRKTRRPRGTRPLALTGDLFPRVRQCLFGLHGPVDVQVLAARLCEPTKAVHRALWQLANTGYARRTDAGWVYVRHGERMIHGW